MCQFALNDGQATIGGNGDRDGYETRGLRLAGRTHWGLREWWGHSKVVCGNIVLEPVSASYEQSLDESEQDPSKGTHTPFGKTRFETQSPGETPWWHASVQLYLLPRDSIQPGFSN